jgi:hypothetical protein
MNGPWHRRKLSHTTHLRDLSSSVRILRERHPFEGRALPVMGTVKRRGVLLLLAVLPDGSRSLIPASWTDWKAVEVTDERSNSGTEHRKTCLAKPGERRRGRRKGDPNSPRWTRSRPSYWPGHLICRLAQPSDLPTKKDDIPNLLYHGGRGFYIGPASSLGCGAAPGGLPLLAPAAAARDSFVKLVALGL